MKIAYVIELAGTKRQSGEQIAMLQQARLIDNIPGNQVDIHSYSRDHSPNIIDSIVPLRLRLLPYFRDIFIIPFIGRKFLKKNEDKYDLIVTSSTTFAALYKPKKAKYVVVCHILRTQRANILKKMPKYSLLFNPIINLIIKMLEKRTLRNAEAITVLLPHQKQFLASTLGINSKKITIVANGIDTNAFYPTNDIKLNQIVFSGRCTTVKGIKQLINASDHVNGNIVIVTRRIEPSIKKEIQRKSNMKLIENASKEELNRIYNQSKGLILPSFDEEQPLVVLEAMACGLRVAVSPAGASDIISENDKQNIYMKSIDKNTIAHACNTMLTSESLNVTSNTQLVKNKYSSDINAKETIEFFSFK